ncbi:response regulator transcription factor [Hymenobacter sp. GOD-10R]|uniref:response regulator transcription factor n=1 Tax=Hymenobacter sp. GOD-10R TaxID=3093922 RepID=UPI002D78008A|nr:response regulator transcription factor [Hymenobacter sp. GOD-10R]WRQ29483.1 response regulator transcription factor [Hymenobacter sp. GOD-10R]
MPARLLILDDHRMLTQSLALSLTEQPDLVVTAQFADGQALMSWLATAGSSPADILLLDLHLPGTDGLSLLPRLRQLHPGLRILVFSMATTPRLMEQLAAAGAVGFVPKSADMDELLAAIRRVREGKTVFPKQTRTSAAQLPVNGADPLLKLQRLSNREREIVKLVCEGLTTRDIAERLFLAELTVSTHRRNIMHKLEISNVAALVQFAIDHGL